MKRLDAVATGVAKGISQVAPHVFVGCCLAIAIFFVVTLLRGDGVGVAARVTLGLTTGVQAPENGWQTYYQILAWLVSTAGWLVLPTSVALLLSSAERKLEQEAELKFYFYKIAIRLCIPPEKRNLFVQKMMTIKDNLTESHDGP